MEMSILKMIGNLMSSMTLTETVSLLSIVAAALFMGARGMVQLTEFIKKTSLDSSNRNPKSVANNTNNEQILIQLSLIRDRLLAIETRQNNMHIEMPKELSSEIAHLFKKIDEGNAEHTASHKDILKMISVLEDGVSIVKEKIAHLEQTLPNLKSDSKDDIKEVNQNVQSVAKDLATLQGTILGNMSSRGGR
jgi:hypothetical protein